MRKFILCVLGISLFMLPWLLHSKGREQAAVSTHTERVSSAPTAGPEPAFILFEAVATVQEEQAKAQAIEDFRVQSETAYAQLVDEELGRQAYAAAIQQELDRRPKAAAPRAATAVGSTVGDCSGFAIPDYIIMRESGGNPSAYNPSGAYGCAQTLLSHYSSGSCRGLDPYTIEGQRACVDILSAGGTNLSPWAQTR
jgi:hypothetical protein